MVIVQQAVCITLEWVCLRCALYSVLEGVLMYAVLHDFHSTLVIMRNYVLIDQIRNFIKTLLFVWFRWACEMKSCNSNGFKTTGAGKKFADTDSDQLFNFYLLADLLLLNQSFP
jgi:hypothetical protein